MTTATTARELVTALDNRAAATELAGSARRQLAIFTHDFEPAVYDTPEFIEAAKNLALSGRGARIRILLLDSTRAAREGHRMIELARRLPSYIEIRKPHEDYRSLIDAFVIADERGVLVRRLADRWEGIYDGNDPLQARERLKLFDEIWQRSQTDVETRQLRI